MFFFEAVADNSIRIENSVSIEISNEKNQKVEVKISVSHTYII